MSQEFPDIEGTDKIDAGILDLQKRDNAALTLFAGEEEPSEPFQDLLWNDLTNKQLKRYNQNEWEVVIDYGTDYSSIDSLLSNFQPLNSNLTAYSEAERDDNVFGVITNRWIPFSSFFINNLSEEIPNNIGLKELAYRSKLTADNINDGSISEGMLTSSVTTTPVYRVGDCIPSFNTSKSGCLRLSTNSANFYTVGNKSSNSTYADDKYRDLFKFVWQKLNLRVFSYSGTTTTKGSSWESDWNGNKRLELPSVNSPLNNTPSNVQILSATTSSTRASEKSAYGNDTTYKKKNPVGTGYYEIVDIVNNNKLNLTSQKTVKGSVSIPKAGYYEVIVVGAGGGSSDRANNANSHHGSGGAGAFFRANVLLSRGTLNYEIGLGGNGCIGYAENHCGWDGSYSRLSGLGININCPGGYGGASSKNSGIPSSISGRSQYEGTSFAPTYTMTTSYYSIIAKSTTGLRTASWYGSYGKGGDRVGNKDSGKIGSNGFVSVKYIGPAEYGTDNTSQINALNAVYRSLNYFIKF